MRNQLSLFLALTIAISVPLWFYSEKILFNARYKAAKSEVLQQWLKESDLELTDVDILTESHTLYLSLEGPSPPVNVEELHRRLIDAAFQNDTEGYKIKYTWTQKVSGVWPQKGQSINEIAKKAKASVNDLMAKTWVWESTQYDADSAAKPVRTDEYTVVFLDKGKFKLTALCGTWKGTYSFSGRSLTIDMNRNWLSGCRKDDVLKIFLDDLDRGRTAFIEDNHLQITLAGGGGIIYFEGR